LLESSIFFLRVLIDLLESSSYFLRRAAFASSSFSSILLMFSLILRASEFFASISALSLASYSYSSDKASN
jgi:hypothetical protein